MRPDACQVLDTERSFACSDVTVRLARTREHAKWDRLVREHHALGFKRFAGRCLRYIVEYQGQWLCLVGWQTSVLKLGARDRWIGWDTEKQFQRLHLIANNTTMKSEGGGVMNRPQNGLGTSLQSGSCPSNPQKVVQVIGIVKMKLIMLLPLCEFYQFQDPCES